MSSFYITDKNGLRKKFTEDDIAEMLLASDSEDECSNNEDDQLQHTTKPFFNYRIGSDVDNTPMEDEIEPPETHEIINLNAPTFHFGKYEIPTIEELAIVFEDDLPIAEEVSVNYVELDCPGDNPLPTTASSDEVRLNYTSKSDIKWDHQPFVSKTYDFDYGQNEDFDENHELNPIDFFRRYITNEVFDQFVLYTNMYALQKTVKGWKSTHVAELEILFGLHILVGNLKLPQLSLYWNRDISLQMFTENMSYKRFCSLRNNLHITDLSQKPPNNNDRLYHVRPLIHAVRNRCLALVPEKILAVDEAIIPFKGQLNIKQYIRGKPCPWGIKMFLLCGKSGCAYDFFVYQGSGTELDEKTVKMFGFGAAAVLHLTNNIKSEGHEIYFDNYFTTYQLIEILDQKKINCAGTIRINRFVNPPFVDDKTLKRNGRGSNDEIVSTDGKVVLVKWYDNKPVHMASNFVGVGKEDEVKRWNKKGNRYEMIKRPEVVDKYNHGMGGVDLFDQMMSYYRVFLKSKKWPLRVIFHLIDFAVLQSYYEYKTRISPNPEIEVMPYLDYRFRLAKTLIYASKTIQKKKGRPSSANIDENIAEPKKAKPEFQPLQEIRFDHTDHLPLHDQKKLSGRCKFPGCSGKSHIICSKCKVHLCMNANNNCFYQYHKN